MKRWLVVLIGVLGVFVLAGAESFFVSPPAPETKESPAISTAETTSTATTVTSGASATSVSAFSGGEYEVAKIVDGDTIDVLISGEVKRVRYIGINTPETVHPTRGVECFGQEASTRNKALVEGKRVRLERDISDADKYGRLLRYVYVGEVFVNEVLVREGYANVSTYPPDVRYTELFREAEVQARTAGGGLWGRECVPYQSPSSEEGGGQSVTGRACIIKGNIAAKSGERIYHTPECAYYNQTVITEYNGERWFCTEEEAQASGWRKAFNCQ